MKIQNAFRVGLMGGLGVLLAVAIGGAVVTLSAIITYVGAALFLALGIDPAVSWLERHRFPRWAAILVVLVGILGIFVGLVFAIVPVIVDQVNNLVTNLPDFIDTVTTSSWVEDVQGNLPSFINLSDIIQGVVDWVKNNLDTIGGGLFSVGVSIASGAAGFVVILILT
ncbi:MAG: hypothetical protein JWO10_2285, partial [Microbacteriaceae bacterium]|nr:hypothetical protein [Microbacteriaceae bacterium]